MTDRCKAPGTAGSAGVSPNATYFLPEAKPLECASLLAPFMEARLLPTNWDQSRLKSGSKLPHSKAPSARDAKSNAALGETPALRPAGPELASFETASPEPSHIPYFTILNACSAAARRASGPTGKPVAPFIQRSGAMRPWRATRSNSGPILPVFFI
jgi:hypothetical protein